ncbi:peptidyl-prolyl cis-trans isomerase D [Zhouia amylolytica]|uniref:Periplasmic chaperone PpiD n=1 Tax=Zhouia amylolytica TaxID=376730 RepID=A0A1I6P2Q5_9FLAO|nr:peptidylprolyl isomerase [Zhouia amylolytica]SFS34443.1 peptidyl-prolyl cis-trans isomerase D [Zhouia amylolytica]
MAILEKIRSRSLILILVIGLALFAFVVSDLFNNNAFSSTKSNVGEINGNPVSREGFAQQVDNLSRQYQGRASTLQIVNQVWNQEVRMTLLEEQFEELGINIEKDQIINVVKSNPQLASNPAFLNEAGVFDAGKFVEYIADLKANNPMAYQQWEMQENALINASKEQSYFNLIKAGVVATIKDGELSYKLENDKVDFKYVQVPYSSIADSTITVTDGEISAYIKDHKKEFEGDASRNIRYVFFEEKASEADVAEIRNEVEALLNKSVVYNNATQSNDTIPGFAELPKDQVAEFVAKHSDVPFDTTYVAKAQLPTQFSDTLFNLGVGEVYGPYKDGETFKLTRMMDKREGGNVKASHILIGYEGTGVNLKENRTKEEAEALAKEVLAKVKADEDFAALAREYSEDPGSAFSGGTYDNIFPGQMVKPFNDFIFDNEIGSVDLVETDFGYHIIKVEDKYNVVQLATISRKVIPSEETSNELYTKATKFEMDAAADPENFGAVAKESDYTVRPVNSLMALQEMVPGLGEQRRLIQWAFNPETKVGDVSRFDVTGGYAIVQLTRKIKEGLMSVDNARALVAPIIRKQKKAAQIIEANNGKSLDELASANNVTVKTATDLNMKTPSIAGAGREPKVVGTAFAIEEGASSGLIEGENGVYMVQVTKKNPAVELDNYAPYATTQRTTNRGRATGAAFNALRENADIEDNRADFY